MKTYPLGLVGERNYQAAIALCRAGDIVEICREAGNPHDDRALRVEDLLGRTIGYIARDSWLRDRIHDEGRGCSATIKSIGAKDIGLLGVVLNVALTEEQIPERVYTDQAQGRNSVPSPRQPAPKSEVGSFVTGFFKGIFK